MLGERDPEVKVPRLRPNPREVRCEGCGATFECARWFGCWCTKVDVPKERRSALKLLSDDCVCRACLESGQRLER